MTSIAACSAGQGLWRGSRHPQAFPRRQLAVAASPSGAESWEHSGSGGGEPASYRKPAGGGGGGGSSTPSGPPSNLRLVPCCHCAPPDCTSLDGQSGVSMLCHHPMHPRERTIPCRCLPLCRSATGKPLAPWTLTFDLKEKQTLWTQENQARVPLLRLRRCGACLAGGGSALGAPIDWSPRTPPVATCSPNQHNCRCAHMQARLVRIVAGYQLDLVRTLLCLEPSALGVWQADLGRRVYPPACRCALAPHLPTPTVTAFAPIAGGGGGGGAAGGASSVAASAGGALRLHQTLHPGRPAEGPCWGAYPPPADPQRHSSGL